MAQIAQIGHNGSTGQVAPGNKGRQCFIERFERSPAMRRKLAAVTVSVLAVGVAIIPASANAAVNSSVVVSTKAFSKCAELRKVYPHGVAKAGAKEN